MFSTKLVARTLATASLAFGLAAAPLALSGHGGLIGQTAAAKETESGGKHSEPGDKRGGKNGNDDRSGDKRGGDKSKADDNPGSHSRNGKHK